MPTVEPSEMEHYAPEMWVPPTVVTHRKSLADKVGGWRRFVDVETTGDDQPRTLWRRATRDALASTSTAGK